MVSACALVLVTGNCPMEMSPSVMLPRFKLPGLAASLGAAAPALPRVTAVAATKESPPQRRLHIASDVHRCTRDFMGYRLQFSPGAPGCEQTTEAAAGEGQARDNYASRRGEI